MRDVSSVFFCECSEEVLIEDLCCFRVTLGKCTILFEELTYTTPSVSSVSDVVLNTFVVCSALLGKLSFKLSACSSDCMLGCVPGSGVGLIVFPFLCVCLHIESRRCLLLTILRADLVIHIGLSLPLSVTV